MKRQFCCDNTDYIKIFTRDLVLRINGFSVSRGRSKIKRGQAELVSAPHMQSIRHVGLYASCTPSKPLVLWGAEINSA
jgi:hypothetical protein